MQKESTFVDEKEENDLPLYEKWIRKAIKEIDMLEDKNLDEEEKNKLEKKIAYKSGVIVGLCLTVSFLLIALLMQTMR